MLAIAGGKGGCGKTSTACGLARALVRAGHRPLVADADVDMPDLHDRVGATADPGLDAIAAGAAVASVVQSDHDLEGAGIVASGAADSPAAALQRLALHKGPVVVDCPAGAGPDVAEAVQVADRSVVVSTDTRASLQDAAKTAAMCRTLGTPVVCLFLRRTRGSAATRLDDDRLRRLVEAPAVIRLPADSDYLDGSMTAAVPGSGPAATSGAFEALASVVSPSVTRRESGTESVRRDDRRPVARTADQGPVGTDLAASE
ncbi:MAG: ParA family protein [Haloarculaceae archaeon]